MEQRRRLANDAILWNRGFFSLLVLLLLLSSSVAGQTASETRASNQYTESTLVPASGSPVFVDVLVAAGGTGNHVRIHKVGGNIAVSLVQPNGAEITPANASQLGYEFLESGPGDQASTLSPLDSVMTASVSIIRFAANSPAGAYRVKAVGQNLAQEGGVTVQYSSETGVRSAIRADASRLQVGSAVALSGFVFENDAPVTGASVVAHVHREQNPPAGVSVVGWTLTGQVDHGNGESSSSYRLLIGNSGDEVPMLYVRAATQQSGLLVSKERLIAYVVAGQATTETGAELTVGHPTGSSPNFGAISWQLTAPAPVLDVPLTDGGDLDGATGDGIYTGAIVPDVPGIYGLETVFQGQAGTGFAFKQNVFTEFEVTPTLGGIDTVGSAAADTDSDGHVDALRVLVNANVVEAGKYRLHVTLEGPAGSAAETKWATATQDVETSGGSISFAADVPASQLREAFAMNGPYRISHLSIVQRGTGTLIEAREDIGNTAPFALNEVPLPLPHFLSGHSAAAADRNGTPGYDVLVATIHVNLADERCSVDATLQNAQGAFVDSARADGYLGVGATSVALAFSGPRIARSGLDGPYRVTDATVRCGDATSTLAELAVSPPYLATDFENVPADFTVRAEPISILRGQQKVLPIHLEATGGFKGLITIGISGLPAGVSAGDAGSESPCPMLTGLWLSVAEDAALGAYPVQVTGTHEGVTRTSAIQLLIVEQDGWVWIEPEGRHYLHPGQQKQFYREVRNLPNFDVVWDVPMAIGSVTSTGLYTAPATIPIAAKTILRAISTVDTSSRAMMTLDLLPMASLELSATRNYVRAGEQLSITPIVSNAGHPAVASWTLSPANGSLAYLEAGRQYEAPASISEAATVEVSAALVEDPRTTGTITITLLPDIQVQISPILKEMQVSAVQTFTATVLHDPSNAGVAWTVNPSVGTLSADGVYTAPASIASQQTVTVTATSVADGTRSANATVTLLPPVSIVVGVAPVSASLRQGQTHQFTATVTNATNAGVTWTLSPGVGSVNASGLYTAPATIATEQTVTVTATSVEDGTKSASATVTLLPPVTVSVSPTSATLRQSQTRQFAATVTNATNIGVTWSVSPSVGTVNASGLYTAPASIATEQTVTVTATSVEDGTKAASATVTLQPPVAASVSPTSATLRQGQTQQFAATVTNATNTGVTWTLNPSVGSVNASGLYTAPASIASQQTVTVTATSVEDGTKAASATVTLRPPVAVSVSPTTASLSGGGTRQFTATVTNATNSGVTWARSPGVGSVSASGLYTAPSSIATQQTVTVTATSVEDATKAASATVTLLPPANAKPSIQGATPSNGAGWATVFKYVFSDANGAEDIATAEVAYSAGSAAPFANSCWFVYSKSTNAVRLYNNAGTGFVSGQIVADTSGGNLSNSRCSLVGGSLKAYPAGNTLTIFLGIGFTTGTARNYTARLKATDAAGAVAGYSPYGTWTVPAATAPPSSPAASGSGSPSAPLTVSLVDTNNTSLYEVDIDDIQTLVTKTGGGGDSCRFFYFAPAEMIVLMDDDDVHWAGVSKAGGGGDAISNSKCMVNAAAAQKTYDGNTKRFGITVPVTAHGTFTGTKYVYVGGSDLSGNIASPSWVHSWTTN